MHRVWYNFLNACERSPRPMIDIFDAEGGGWQFRAIGETSFVRDEIKLFLAARVPDGLRIALPAPVELDAPIDPFVATDTPPEPFLRIPSEAAEALLQALATQLYGGETATLLGEVQRLRRELKAERLRVDRLIEGIGAPRATAPRGNPTSPKDGPS